MWRPPPPPSGHKTRHEARQGLHADPGHSAASKSRPRHKPAQASQDPPSCPHTDPPPCLKGRGAAGQVEYSGPLACAATGGWWGGGGGGGGGLDRAEVALASHGEVCYGAFDHSCDEAV